MNILYVLIPLALLLGIFFVVAFIWATKKGQFDDLDTPAARIVLDDEYRINDKQEGKKNE
ncbi:cbb3-type cytochrome oxidase assembly protein CcoS [Halobacteriovorax sp. JY17]|uniref:cbb3-type cytochrome oxidase assembly protein CcoS n=1 Tax=Halobacteriovorax sp. JY17 TaxID=2014617 RepID=UPI000C40030D|nr:cbb3-type cytochrome oxidase assembly protein CcoS [Halobacteriovorax sp. JY17]PIK15420.1 MAG: cbb3-type cytochrome oxidase assembly protein CcoS [Halobacteriovorax sp. JY17]